MHTQIASIGLRPLGTALLLTIVIFLIGASTAAYFWRWPLPSDPLDQLTLIANDRVGWSAQAILFLVAYLGTAVVFGLLAIRMPNAGLHWLAGAATLLFAIGFLAWLPISIDRLQLGANAADLIRTYDPATPPNVMGNFGWAFWMNTFAILAALVLMGAALAMAAVLPILGWVVAATAVAGALIGGLLWGDWPPFMSYLILLVLAIGLMRTGAIS